MPLTEAQIRTIEQLRANGLVTEAATVEKRLLEEELSTQRQKIKPPVAYGADGWLKKIVTDHPDTIRQKELCRILADVEDPVLILGPSGTGKELYARALHHERTGAFVAINCAGLPEHLIEHELFGSAKGAFTGADKTKVGLFQAATRGTLFLDEIGELPLGVQAKLLRVLDTYTVRKVGSNDEEDINCRFVCATHRDLPALVKQNTFRLDLYYRISTFRLVTYHLSARSGDCQLIANYYYRGEFPQVDWTTVDLSGGVRKIKQIVRRYQVLKEVITL